MICRFTCGNCGRTWVFESRFINPAEFSCPFKRVGGCMPKDKKVVIRHGDHRHERTNDSVEAALKEIAKEAKKGDLEFPFVLEFDGPGGALFNISIGSVEAAQEVSTLGFMF